MIRQLSLVVFGILLATTLVSQDFHFSQFMHTPLHLSPGLTGVFSGDTRVGATYRSQWNQVPVAYRTFSVFADHKYTCGREGPHFWSSGVALNYDRSGDANLTWVSAGLYGSYTRVLNDQMFLTLGANASLAQRRFEEDDLRFDNQFNVGTGSYDPGLGNGENFGRQSYIFPDFAIGANFRWQAKQPNVLVDLLDKRTKVDVGVGLHHLTRPDMSFVQDVTVNLPMRLSAYADANLQVVDEVDLRLAIKGQFQNAYRQYLGAVGAKIHLDRSPGEQFSVVIGAGYRFDAFGDAWYPMLEVHYHEQLRASISYDINISDFTIATDRRGGLELNIRYLFKKVCPIPNFRFCPLI